MLAASPQTHPVDAGMAALAGTVPLAMGRRLLLTYLHSSLVDLFIFIYLQQQVWERITVQVAWKS